MMLVEDSDGFWLLYPNKQDPPPPPLLQWDSPFREMLTIFFFFLMGFGLSQKQSHVCIVHPIGYYMYEFTYI